jgi:aminoglycoside phosphotransferase (APT) family kinase protein
MTHLPGDVVWRPADRDGFLRRLAEVLPAVHGTGVPSDPAIGPYEPYALRVTRPPSWSARPGVWRRALDAFRGPAPEAERRFLHRDYHPGNVLWTDGAVSGIVDWVNASVGDPGVDVGHCRMNLAGALGLDAADRFLELYGGLTGRGEHHPYWDIVAALGGFEQADVERWSACDEDFLAQAVALL